MTAFKDQKVSIVHQAAPSLVDNVKVNFELEAFEKLVWDNGYDVYHDKFIECPCRLNQVGANTPLSSCKNCRGVGYTQYNRTKTKMVLQNANYNTKFREWSKELTGTVSITCLSKDRLGYMDRIINLNFETVANEIIIARIDVDYIQPGNQHLIAYSNYWISSVESIFMYKSDKLPLLQLTLASNDQFTDGDFIFKKNIIIFNPNFIQDHIDPLKTINDQGELSFSIRYNHFPTFHVVDLLKDIRVQIDKNSQEHENFPISAIAKRSHSILDKDNYDDTFYVNNTNNTTIGVYYPKPNPLFNENC